MSEVLSIVLAKGELTSSIIIGLEDSHKYGDITRVEFDTANRMIGKWLAVNPEMACTSFTNKKNSFKTFIKRTKENESMSVR